MANTSVPAKNKLTKTYNILKAASCPTLSQTGIIDYEITRDDTGAHHIGLTGNSGAGYFSKAKQPVIEIIASLEQFESEYPLTSLALKDHYPSVSINSWSFLMAVLLAEGLVERLEDNKRRFRLCDTNVFLASLDKLKAKHRPQAKRKPKAKA